MIVSFIKDSSTYIYVISNIIIVAVRATQDTQV